MKDMIARQDAVAIVSDRSDLQRTDDVVLLPFANKRLRWQVYALRRSGEGAKEPAILAFTKYVQTAFEKNALVA